MSRHLLRSWLWAALLAGATGPLLAQSVTREKTAPAPVANGGATESLSVRYGDRTRAVPTIRHPDGSLAVRADAFADALGGRFIIDPALRRQARLELGKWSLAVQSGSVLAIAGDDTIPLTSEVARRGTIWYLPLTVATDVLPRSGVGVLFDEERREVRRFAAVAPAKRATPSGATSGLPSGSAVPRPSPTSADSESRGAGAAAERRGGTRQRIVVVDAGHGGRDRGMSGPLGAPNKVYEKTVTLAVSKALQKALEERGVTVIMTRTTDTLINLYDRGRIANKAQGDLFVSIHVNAANPGWKNPAGARGYETYFLAEAKTEDERRVEAMENEAIRFETSVDASRSDPLGFIIRDMAQNEHLRESSRLAQFIQGGMKAVHPGPSRGIKQAGFVVLVTAFMPAVLVEVGFGSNRDDSQFMTNPTQQAKLSASIADAIVRYLAEYDRKVGGS